MIDTNSQIYYLDFDRMIDQNTGDLMENPDIKRIEKESIDFFWFWFRVKRWGYSMYFQKSKW